MGQLSSVFPRATGRRSFALVMIVALFLLSAFACGGGTPHASTVHAPGEGARTYSSDVASHDDEQDVVDRGIAQATKGSGAPLTRDARLDRLASLCASHVGEGGTPPPQEVVELFARHLGLIEPVPHLLILGNTSLEGLRGGVADGVGQFLRRQPYSHYGATISERGSLQIAVVALSARWLEIEPLPREVGASEVLHLRGQLRPGYRSATVAITPPQGPVERRPAGRGAKIDTSVELRETGTYRIEVLASGPRGDAVVANFPIYVGVAPPTSVSLVAETDAESSNPDEIARGLLRRLNQARSEQSLPLLKEHQGLQTIATSHSRDMVSSSFVGHVSPTSGSAADRVRRGGFTVDLVLENIGRGYGAEEIYRGLMDSPGHRANMLSRDATHIGIGVVPDREDGRTAFVATLVFIRLGAVVDTERGPEELLESLNRGRQVRGAAPLKLDKNLAKAAQNALRVYYDDPTVTRQEAVDSASGAVRRYGIQLSRVGGLMVVVRSISEAERLEPLFDPEIRYLGIGMIKADRDGHPPGSVGILILMGWPR